MHAIFFFTRKKYDEMREIVLETVFNDNTRHFIWISLVLLVSIYVFKDKIIGHQKAL